jgi:DNA-binding Lrp family transcriptional regulator
MTNGFVAVTVEGEASTAATEIAAIDGVATAHHVMGEFDVIAELDLSDPDSLQQVVTGSIQTVEGVTETTTTVPPELAAHHTPETDRATADRDL